MSSAAWNPFTRRGDGEEGGKDAAGAAQADRGLRIGIFSFSSGEFNSRSHRLARSAVADGHEVTIYARSRRGLPAEELVGGYRIVRLPSPLSLLLPWGRRKRLDRRRSVSQAGPQPVAQAPKEGTPAASPSEHAASPGVRRKGHGKRGTGAARRSDRGSASRVRALLRPAAMATRPVRRFVVRVARRLIAPFKAFPLQPMAWAVALEDAVTPADIWHGMWGTSLPALGRVRARHGGRTIYDCRDILLRSREYEDMSRLPRRVLGMLERRWARACDAVITVNEPYAGIVQRLFDIEPPAVVMNCPERWDPPTPRPDRIRDALGIPATTGVVLYQGSLRRDRGIEQSLEAVLAVPDACLVLLGFGPDRDAYRAQAADERYRGRLHLLEGVAPVDLPEWTASADVMVMAIQPTSLNHRYTTPQKLFEAMAVGVPVVASDLPGMAPIVRETGCGELCDPRSPEAIAAALRRILGAPPEVRAAYGQRALDAAHATYNWESQLLLLGDVYARVLGREGAVTGRSDRN